MVSNDGHGRSGDYDGRIRNGDCCAYVAVVVVGVVVIWARLWW